MNFPGILRPARVAFLIGLAVFVLGGILWRTGQFEEPELWFYDQGVRWHAQPDATDSQIVLVLLKESDIRVINYPLRDSVYGQMIEKIESGGPSVVGSDFYRDLPEPRDHSEEAELIQTLKKYPNFVSIFLSDSVENPIAIAPPKAVADDPLRIAFNNFPDTKVIRRAFLLWPYGNNFKGTPYMSFALMMAQYYFADHNIDIAQEGDLLRLGKTVIPMLGPNDGGYMHNPTGGYAFLQDCRGPWKFDTYSVTDVLAMKDTSVFKGKMVVMGIDASSSNDKFTTPISALESPMDPKEKLANDTAYKVSGVLVHAQIADQLLRIATKGEKPTAWFSQSFLWCWLALWCVIGVLVGFFTKSHHIFALTVVLCLVLIVVLGWTFFIHGYWILVFTPLIIFTATAMLVKGYAASHEEEQRKMLMKLFSQRVNPEVAEDIWNNRDTFLEGGRPVARSLVVTALFTDLKNYSTISEGMTPVELIAWVNECQAALTKHVRKNSGMVLCFMGDGMMATYGAPIPRQTEDERAADAINAVRSALGMGEEIRRMNAKWKAAGRPLAGLRIGIFTGEAVAGDLGTDEYMEYSIIGDTINTASRLESVDKEGTMTKAGAEVRILIGARTNQYICNHFPTRRVGELELKGKTEKTVIYKVLDSEDEPEHTNRVSS